MRRLPWNGLAGCPMFTRWPSGVFAGKESLNTVCLHSKESELMFRRAAYPVYLLMLLLPSLRAAAVPAVTGTVPIGPRPVTVAVDRSSRVYVADTELGAVMQLDGSRAAPLATIE